MKKQHGASCTCDACMDRDEHHFTDWHSELPSAYRITRGSDGRFYPLRFGQFRRNSVNGPRLSFGLYSEAAAYCQAEQAEYQRLYPAPSDRK